MRVRHEDELRGCIMRMHDEGVLRDCVALVLLLGGASAVSVGPPAVRFRSAARGRSPQGEGLRGHPSPGGEGGLQAAHLSRIRGRAARFLFGPRAK